MRVVNICIEDHANFSYENAQALRSIGVECDSFKIKEHPFNYEHQSKIVTFDEMEWLIKSYDVIQIMHSATLPFKPFKPYVVWHTGTTYRMNYKSLNEHFKGVKPVIALGEFAELCPDYTYIVGAIDVDKYKPKYPTSNEVHHYPSCHLTKGTAFIEKMCFDLNIHLHCDKERVDFNDHIKRLKNADIYVELFALIQNGRPYGSWGITTLEAAALGKVVMTCHTTQNIYKEAYGDTPLIISNNEIDFKRNLRILKSTPKTALKILGMRSRAWVENNHSYQATGLRVKKFLESI